jgi:hypothetical protein
MSQPAKAWTLADAKAHLSEVFESALKKGPQVIPRHGREGRGGRRRRGVGAEDEASGNARGLLRGLALAGIGSGDRTSPGRPPRHRPMSFLLDTKVISEWVKPAPNPNVTRWLDEVDEDQVFLSVASLAEIRHGVELMDPGSRRDRLS